jgi:hypothetical protein
MTLSDLSFPASPRRLDPSLCSQEATPESSPEPEEPASGEAVVESATPEPVMESATPEPAEGDAPEPVMESAEAAEEPEAVMESATPEPVVEAATPEPPEGDAPASPEGEVEGEDPNALDAVPEGGDYDAMKDMAEASEESAAARLAQLQAQVEAQHQQLEVESKTNAELEDMLLRIEKHFKAEQVARRTAEEKASAAEAQISDERELREKAQLELKNRMHEGERNAQLKAALAAERGALEAEKAKVEAEIEEARGDAQRSAEALARAEEAIRQEETVARLKLESEHNAKVSRLAVEIDRLKEELEQRTNAMGNEMMRWKSQADAAANAVSLAKDEVMERKKELDITKEKMDHLVEKLYIGREKGLELRGAIDFHLERHRTNFGSGSSRNDSVGLRRKPCGEARRVLRPGAAQARRCRARRARRQDGHRRARAPRRHVRLARHQRARWPRARGRRLRQGARREALKIYSFGKRSEKRLRGAFGSVRCPSTRGSRFEVRFSVYIRRASRARPTDSCFYEK